MIERTGIAIIVSWLGKKNGQKVKMCCAAVSQVIITDGLQRCILWDAAV